MKRGNELTKKSQYKIFLYCDDDFEMGLDNIFLSGIYKNAKQFHKENPGMRPLISYEAESTLLTLNKQLRKMKSKK